MHAVTNGSNALGATRYRCSNASFNCPGKWMDILIAERVAVSYHSWEWACTGACPSPAKQVKKAVLERLRYCRSGCNCCRKNTDLKVRAAMRIQSFPFSLSTKEKQALEYRKFIINYWLTDNPQCVC